MYWENKRSCFFKCELQYFLFTLSRHGSKSVSVVELIQWFYSSSLKGNSFFFKPWPYFSHEIRLSTHREQFGESRRPLRAI